MPISPATSTPPQRRSAPRKSGAASSVPPVSQSEARLEGLNGLAQIGVAVCVMRGQYADAGAIAIHGPNVARETVSLAAQNEQIGKALDYLISAGPYAGLLTAVLPLALQIAANHDRIDAEKISGFDIMPPEVLETRIKADMDQKKLAMMQAAQHAQREAERVRAEMASATQNGAPE